MLNHVYRLAVVVGFTLACVACQSPEVLSEPSENDSELSLQLCANRVRRAEDGTYAKLSDTGLYCNIDFLWLDANLALSSGLSFFEPEYPMWSDGANKRRWLRLPVGGQIDTSDMDNWKFPVGTKVWKEFSRGSKRLETRMLEKKADGTWLMQAFTWKADQSDALAASTDGAQDVLGTTHDVPAQAQCTSCHRNASDTLLGVAAMQLQRANPLGETLFSLALFGKLSELPNDWYRFPGNATEASALGYLYGNCSNCHRGENAPAGVNFFVGVNDREVQSTNAYLTTVGQPLTRWTGHGFEQRIVAGHPEQSAVIARMSTRVPADQMPKIGSEVVDATGVDTVSDWIKRLR